MHAAVRGNAEGEDPESGTSATFGIVRSVLFGTHGSDVLWREWGQGQFSALGVQLWDGFVLVAVLGPISAACYGSISEPSYAY